MNGNNEVIKTLMQDFQATVLPAHLKQMVDRDLSLGHPFEPKPGNLVKVVVGMRRSGKTYRLFQEIRDLLNAGISADRICYFNFDDDRLRPFDPSTIDSVIESFFELHPKSRSEGTYFFFDEIQEVPQWDIAARRIVDTEKATVYVTGSSSRMLSTDVATEFRGRSISYELLPFSFREYARFHGIDAPTLSSNFNKEQASALKHAFKHYLVQGGFPGIQLLDDNERVNVLQSYAQFTVARDVVERHGFSNAAYAQNLARIALASSGRDFSISKMDKNGKSAGYTPGRAKIAEIIDAFEDAHLLHQVYEFSHSAQKVRVGGFKMYAEDPGLLCALAPATSDGLTRALETVIYLEMRRRSSARIGSIALLKLKSGKEIDFIEGDEAFDMAYELIQVSLNMRDESTKGREVSALQEAMKRFSKNTATIVTLDEEGKIEVEEGIIHIVPAWKWLLRDTPSERFGNMSIAVENALDAADAQAATTSLRYSHDQVFDS